MKQIILFFLISTSMPAQCPCVKTALIGTVKTAAMASMFNNKVIAMEDIAIKRGESVTLHCKENTGTLTWFSKGRRIEELLVSPTETTNYTVKSTLSGCPDAYDMVRITVNDLTDNPQEITVFPNPFWRQFTLVSSRETIKEIVVLNAFGQQLARFSYPYELRQAVIDLTRFSSGIFVIRILLGDQRMVSKKIIKI